MTLNSIECPDGGVMVECYRDPDWGQVNLRSFPPGASTAPHRHPRTDESWVVMRGRVRVQYQPWPDEKAYNVVLGVGHRLELPRGCGHRVENAGGEEAVLVYWRSTLYDPDDPDKEPWEQ